MSQSDLLKPTIPGKLSFLIDPHRYKVCYGGRGGGRSWSYARTLLSLGYIKPLRILCAREVQESIKQSVHKLLSDQIELLDLQSFYKIQETTITGRNGTEFSFAGLSSLTADNIKSMEGVDIVWCEEAHKIVKRSWVILIPTIRKDGSEIWVSFNPELESGETYQRFIVNPPDDCVAVKLNWRDNPWFPKVLEKERLYCKKNNPKDYPNIWEGDCKPAVEGAIYYDEITATQAQNRICDVPYDPFLKVHIVMDLGWNDFMAIGLVQRQASALRIIEYIEDDHKTLDYYSAMLKEKKLNWGKMWLPHDAYSKDIKRGKSVAAIMSKLGWDVPKRNEIVELGLEDGIKVTRMTFRRCYFDRTNTDRKDHDGYGSLIECLKRYRRRVNKQTDEPGAPLHDQFCHGCFAAGTLVTMADGTFKKIQDVKCGDKVFLAKGVSGNVSWSGIVKKSETVFLDFSDGTTTECTPDHKYITKRGLVRADALRYSDIYHSNRGAHLWNIQNLLNLTEENIGLREIIADITEQKIGAKGFVISTGLCGRFIMAKFQKDIMSIIKTATAWIAELKTLNVCPPQIISDTMPAKILGLEAMGINSNYEKQENYLKNGTNLLKEEFGIKNIISKSKVNYIKHLKEFVRIAEKNFKRHEARQKMFFVQMFVEHIFGELQEWITKYENAVFAVRDLLSINMLRKKRAVKLVRISHNPKPKKVYDLTVDKHHVYFANGILVSNCDMFRYLCINADQMTNEDDKIIQLHPGAGYRTLDAIVGY